MQNGPGTSIRAPVDGLSTCRYPSFRDCVEFTATVKGARGTHNYGRTASSHDNGRGQPTRTSAESAAGGRSSEPARLKRDAGLLSLNLFKVETRYIFQIVEGFEIAFARTVFNDRGGFRS
jgi:hypothetical protein